MPRGRVIPFPGRRVAAGPTDETPAEVHRCDHAEAVVVKGLLESEGITTVLRSRITHSVHPFTIGAQGEVVILVPTRDAGRAARLLRRITPEPRDP